MVFTSLLPDSSDSPLIVRESLAAPSEAHFGTDFARKPLKSNLQITPIELIAGKLCVLQEIRSRTVVDSANCRTTIVVGLVFDQQNGIRAIRSQQLRVCVVHKKDGSVGEFSLDSTCEEMGS